MRVGRDGVIQALLSPACRLGQLYRSLGLRCCAGAKGGGYQQGSAAFHGRGKRYIRLVRCIVCLPIYHHHTIRLLPSSSVRTDTSASTSTSHQLFAVTLHDPYPYPHRRCPRTRSYQQDALVCPRQQPLGRPARRVGGYLEEQGGGCRGGTSLPLLFASIREWRGSVTWGGMAGARWLSTRQLHSAPPPITPLSPPFFAT